MSGIFSYLKGGVLVLPLLLVACGGVEEFPQTSLAPRSDFARDIDGLFWLTVYLGVGVGVAVFAVIGYITVRYRYRPGQKEPEQVHGHTRLELAWTLIPALILTVVAVPTVQVIFETQAEAPEGALEVQVIGHQWWWQFRYPAGGDTVVTANEIHVPVGRPVELVMTSADVIHSFWVPQMGGKRDLIPNRTTSIVFTPEESGVYLGQCAEFCGDSHALMKMRLIAHQPAEFEEWLANEASPAVEPLDTGSAVAYGKQLFQSVGCAGCHTIRGTDYTFGVQGPDLTHLARRGTIAAGVLENNAANLAGWINDPQGLKPGALMQNTGWTERDVKYLVAYLQTLY
ncbi:MAG: cytochrome c oxidase subunit II [Longimicrobiaceae bacterium]